MPSFPVQLGSQNPEAHSSQKHPEGKNRAKQPELTARAQPPLLGPGSSSALIRLLSKPSPRHVNSPAIQMSWSKRTKVLPINKGSAGGARASGEKCLNTIANFYINKKNMHLLKSNLNDI